jgi:hypothetical protein
MLLATGHFGPASTGVEKGGPRPHAAATPTEAGLGHGQAELAPPGGRDSGTEATAQLRPAETGRLVGPAEPGQPGPSDTGGLLNSQGGLAAVGDAPLVLDPAPQARGDRPRRLARLGVWALLAAPGVLAFFGVWGWPGQTATLSTGTWLAVTAAGVATTLVGMGCIAALLAVTRARTLAVTGALAALFGVVAVLPVVGSVALAHADPTGAGMWLGLGGMLLVAFGWLALGIAVITSQALNGLDGMLILASVGLAAVAGLLSWRLPLVIAAVGMLAAASGLGFTASRLTAGR